MNTKHLKDARRCVFENCEYKFVPEKRSHHFKAKHDNKGQLKAVHLLADSSLHRQSDDISTPTADAGDDLDHDDTGVDCYNLFDIDSIENPEPEHTEESEDYFTFTMQIS